MSAPTPMKPAPAGTRCEWCGSDPVGMLCESCEEVFMRRLAERYVESHPVEAQTGLEHWRLLKSLRRWPDEPLCPTCGEYLDARGRCRRCRDEQRFSPGEYDDPPEDGE